MARKTKEEKLQEAKLLKEHQFNATKEEYAPRLQTAMMKFQNMQSSNVGVNWDSTGVVFHLLCNNGWAGEWTLRYNFTEYEDLYELEGLENYIRSYEEAVQEEKRKSELYKNAIAKLSDEEVQILKVRLNGN